LTAMRRFLGGQFESLVDYLEMRRDWERVLSGLPPARSPTGTPMVRRYASGSMPLRRRWGLIKDSPSPEVANAERQGLLPGKGARAVDFSSGIGRNALFLLKRGLHVRSIVYPDADGLQIGFQKKWADRYRHVYPECGSIDVVPGEFARYELGDDPFDLVVCVSSLMHASMSAGREVIRSLQRKTATGGVHIITTSTIDDGYQRRHEVSDDCFITSGRLYDDELQSLYPASVWQHFGSSPSKVYFNRGALSFRRGLRRVWSIVVARKSSSPLG
jgi:SAM-dependent methyltransferase